MSNNPNVGKVFNLTSGTASEVSERVTSFNGRKGAVLPASGDYTADQVGALPLTGGEITGQLVVDGNANLSNGGVKLRQTLASAATGMTLRLSGDSVAINPGLGTTSEDNAVRVHGVATPVNDRDVANKKYVDDQIVAKKNISYKTVCTTAADVVEKVASCPGFSPVDDAMSSFRNTRISIRNSVPAMIIRRPTFAAPSGLSGRQSA